MLPETARCEAPIKKVGMRTDEPALHLVEERHVAVPDTVVLEEPQVLR